MMSRTVARCLAIFTILVIMGCSKGGNPVTPQDSHTGISEFSSLPVGVTSWFDAGSPASGAGALGLFNLSVNPDEISAELTSVRQTALTDVLEIVDITNFLQVSPCVECARIKSVGIDADGNIVVSIGIKHPFAAGDESKPITASNRADLHVFNVEGTIVSNNEGTDFSGTDQSISEFRLVNADGYSAYLDSVLDDIYPTAATLHPYILHFDDYTSGNFYWYYPTGFSSVTTPSPRGNLVMAMGSDYDYKDYAFKLEDGTMDFIYVVGCTYAVTVTDIDLRFTPEYRIPQHNKKAASEVSVEISSNELKAGHISTTAEIAIRVVDISHGVGVGERLDEMLSDSSVAAITVDIPQIISSPITVDISAPSGSGHSPTDPLVYSATITNELGADSGIYLGLVKVLDSYPPGMNELALLESMDGIQRLNPGEVSLDGLFEITEFATYTVFELPIEFENEPPVAVLEPDQFKVLVGNTVNWDATASNDPDDSIVQYEWDFFLEDGSETNFTPDGAPTYPPESTIISPPYDQAGLAYAAVRVTDEFDATDIAVVTFEVVDPVFDDVYFDFSTIDIKKIHVTGSGFGSELGDSIIYLDGLTTGFTFVSWQDDEIVIQISNDNLDHELQFDFGGVMTPVVPVPESESLLIIYNSNDSDSVSIKDYYSSDVTGRDIKDDMILALDLSFGESITRTQYDDDIKTPVETFIESNNLKYRIKYIVLAKGIPLKIQKTHGSSYTDLDYAALESEMTLLFDNDYNLDGRISNPYYSRPAGEYFHPFKWTGYQNATFAYLVTRLAAWDLDEIYAMIDRGLNPYSGSAAYGVLDGDPGKGYDQMENAHADYDSRGIQHVYDNSNIFVTAVTIGDTSISDNIIAYTGHGVHHNDDPPSGGLYILNDLGFGLLNGAIFNSYESFNGTTYIEASRSSHGMVGDWIRIGGTGGIGHVYEPWSDGVANERLLYPAQIAKNNLAEACWISLRYLSWTETIPGDPLCIIDIQ